jgi:predicted secreted protein
MYLGRLGTLLLAGLLLGGCAATSAGQPAAPRDVLTIACDELAVPGQSGAGAPVARTVAVTAGESFRISLCSNPSTGFSWESPAVAGSAAVSLVDHQVVPPSTTTPGAAGSETFTFRAASAGTATIDFAYSRPWEGGEKAAWIVQVRIDAAPDAS